MTGRPNLNPPPPLGSTSGREKVPEPALLLSAAIFYARHHKIRPFMDWTRGAGGSPLQVADHRGNIKTPCPKPRPTPHTHTHNNNNTPWHIVFPPPPASLFRYVSVRPLIVDKLVASGVGEL
ncbi:unnamed protein product [Arctogadus glacialis]